MNYIDLVFGLILVYSGYKGFSKGFVVYAASFLALLLGIFGAMKFSWFTAGILSRNFQINPDQTSLISFIVTFIAIVIGIHILARIADKLIKAVALGMINRILGLVFSIAKTAFIISIVLIIFTSLNDRMKIIPDQTISESILFRPLTEFSRMVFPHLRFDNVNQHLQHINV